MSQPTHRRVVAHKGCHPSAVDRAEVVWLVVAPIIGRLTLAVLAAIVAMFLFVRLAHEMGDGETKWLDATVLTFLHAHRDPTIFQFMRWVSWMGSAEAQPVTYVLCILGFCLARRFWPDGLTMLLAGLGGGGLMYALKRLFHRPRPEEIFDKLGYSFPSGHSFFAITLYCMLAYWVARDAPPRRRFWIWTTAVCATLLMGFSRIYLGEHFPSDVAAGFAIGVPWIWGCLALPHAFHRRGRDISPDEKRASYQQGAARLRRAQEQRDALTQCTRTLSGNPRFSRVQRFVLWLLAVYVASPIDLVPDFIPLLGAADDFLLAGYVLGWIAKRTPIEELEGCWHGAEGLQALCQGVRQTLADLWKRG